MKEKSMIIDLYNNTSSVAIDLLGGAITSFCLKNQIVNPIDFQLKEELPYGDGFYFQGHFLCVPRWGEPTEREQVAGLCKHGDFARIPWEAVKIKDGYEMTAVSKLEALAIKRAIRIDPVSNIFMVEEYVTNKSPLGRVCQMVQHPTIAAPFLNEGTIVDCNALYGFDYASLKYEEDTTIQWPMVKNKDGKLINISNPTHNDSSVYSFIVDTEQEWGWLTAYSPTHNMVIGYIWPRKDYPWINMWLHYEEGHIKYRGLEFGNTGVHMPFGELLDKHLTHLFGEKTYGYLDAYETEGKQYMTFLQKVDPGFRGVKSVKYTNKELVITAKQSEETYSLTHSFS